MKPSTNTTHERTPIIGREAELTQVEQLIKANSLVTIIGPPGVGKTRLVSELAHARFGPATFTQELELVLAGELAVLDASDVDHDQLAELVDNALNARPTLKIITTASQPLELAGERVFALKPLGADAAAELFEQRATSLNTTAQLPELLAELDYLPREIELAASKTDHMTPAEILKSLDRRFATLESRRRGQAPDILRSSIQALVSALDPATLHVLSQVTVFVNGFDLEAAHAVLYSEKRTPQILSELVRRSLLIKEVDTIGESRFYSLKSVQYYLGQTRPIPPETRESHAHHYAESSKPLLGSLNQTNGSRHAARLKLERGNLEAAFDHSFDTQPGRAAQIAAALDAISRLEPERSLRRLNACLAKTEISLTTRADILARIADHHIDSSDFGAAMEALERAWLLDPLDEQKAWIKLRMANVHRLRGEVMAAIEAHGVVRALAESNKLKRLNWAHEANAWVDLGDFEHARSCLRELQFIPESDDLRRESEIHRRLVYAHFYLGNQQEQRRHAELALKFAEEIGDLRLKGICLQGLADAELSAKSYEAAVQAYRAALETHRVLGNRTFEAMLLGNLAGALHRLGELPEARSHYQQSLALHRSGGTKAWENVVLFALGTLEFEEENLGDARAHFNAALEIATELGIESDAAGYLLSLSWVDLMEGRFASASKHASEAALRFERLGTSDFGWKVVSLATASVAEYLRGLPASLQGVIAEIEGRPEDSQTAMVALLNDWMHQRPAVSSPFAISSLHARMVYRLVQKLPATRPETRPPIRDAELVVGPDCEWFRCADESVDLRRRKSIKLILKHLVELHASKPGVGADAHALFDIGWPGQEIDPEDAARRVYWAIRTLRKNGLDELILTSDDGYLIDSKIRIEVGEEW